jgi:hypothetical protein
MVRLDLEFGRHVQTLAQVSGKEGEETPRHARGQVRAETEHPDARAPPGQAPHAAPDVTSPSNPTPAHRQVIANPGATCQGESRGGWGLDQGCPDAPASETE